MQNGRSISESEFIFEPVKIYSVDNDLDRGTTASVWFVVNFKVGHYLIANRFSSSMLMTKTTS